jgi:hypothetical protein
MKEANWLASDHSYRMLRFLRGKSSDRKLRLFAVACFRRIWHLLTDEWTRNVVELAERSAEGKGVVTELRFLIEVRPFPWKTVDAAAILTAIPHCENYNQWFLYGIEEPDDLYSGDGLIRDIWVKGYRFPDCVAHAVARQAAADDSPDDALAQAAILRCLFGPRLYRAVPIDPTWLTWNGGTVLKLAQIIHQERRFADLPILADALEEAGCGHKDILGHCREQGPHYRGCWVVDLLLGKK